MAFAAKNKKYLGYALYVILVTLALFYYLFPAEAVKEFIDASVSRINPQLGFRAENIRPSLPAGLRINNGRIILQDNRGADVFAVDSLYIGPKLLKLVRGDYTVDFSGTAYKGALDGALHVPEKDGKTVEAELSFRNWELGDYSFLAAKLQQTVTGRFSGNIAYSRKPEDPAGSGRADMKLTDGRVQFEKPIFGIGSLDLQNIGLELELANGQVTIVRAELAGPEVKADMTGSIQLQPDINDSRLNLRGTLEPLAEFYKNYPDIRDLMQSMKKRVRRGQYSFAVTGTLGKPEFRFL